MDKPIQSLPEVAKALFEKMKLISAKIFRQNYLFGMASKGEFGQIMRRFFQKPATATFTEFNSSATLAAFVVESGFSRQAAENARAIIDHSLELARTNAAHNSALTAANVLPLPLDNVCLRPAFADAQILKFQEEMQLYHFDRVMNGSFIGPLSKETLTLKAAFENNHISREVLQRDFLAIQGIGLDRNGTTMVSEAMYKNLHSPFGHYSSPAAVHPISIFKRAASINSAPDTRVIGNNVAANDTRAPVPLAA